MSAWVCSKAHIDAMVTAAINLGGSFSNERYGYLYFGEPSEKINLSPQDADKVGQMLRDTIVTGVSHRYPDDDVSKGELPGPSGGAAVWYLKPYKWEKTRELADGEIVSLISAYEYQACEHNEWAKTFGAKFCDHVKYKLLKRVQEAFEQKNGETQWGYEEQHVFPDCKQWAVALRAVEFPMHCRSPLVLVPARSAEAALANARMWYGDFAEVIAAAIHEGDLTPAEVEAEVKRNDEWVAERTPNKPAAPTPVEFKAPASIPADLAALLNRVAADDAGPNIRNN